MIDNTPMFKTILTVSAAWMGTGITLATIGTWVGIGAGIMTIEYTTYKWRMDVLDRRKR